MNLIYKDFAKRDFHLWVYRTHNAHALARQFPKYPLNTLYRVRAGIQPKYMPYRTYMTLKSIMCHADEHKAQARKLTLEDIAVKHKVSVETVRQLNREWSNGNEYDRT